MKTPNSRQISTQAYVFGYFIQAEPEPFGKLKNYLSKA